MSFSVMTRDVEVSQGFLESAMGTRDLQSIRKLAENPNDCDALLAAEGITSRMDATEDAVSIRSALTQCRRVAAVNPAELQSQLDANEAEQAELQRAFDEVKRKLNVNESARRELTELQTRLNADRRELSLLLMKPLHQLAIGDEINTALRG